MILYENGSEAWIKKNAYFSFNDIPNSSALCSLVWEGLGHMDSCFKWQGIVNLQKHLGTERLIVVQILNYSNNTLKLWGFMLVGKCFILL